MGAPDGAPRSAAPGPATAAARTLDLEGTAPSAFRFTHATAPERDLRAAELMGYPVAGLGEPERREALPRALLAW